MVKLSFKWGVKPIVALSAALTLGACASHNAGQSAFGSNGGFGGGEYNSAGFEQGFFATGSCGSDAASASHKVKSTRYGGQYIVDNNCGQTCCLPVQAPIQRPVVEILNVVEVPAPTPAPVIEYVYEPAPAPTYATEPVYVPESQPETVYVPQPAPLYIPEPEQYYQPAPSCPEGQIPAYGGNGCIPIVPLRK